MVFWRRPIAPDGRGWVATFPLKAVNQIQFHSRDFWSVVNQSDEQQFHVHTKVRKDGECSYTYGKQSLVLFECTPTTRIGHSGQMMINPVHSVMSTTDDSRKQYQSVQERRGNVCLFWLLWQSYVNKTFHLHVLSVVMTRNNRAHGLTFRKGERKCAFLFIYFIYSI